MLSILVESDDRRPTAVSVQRFPCRIGKARDAEVQLPGWRVARVHAEIHRLDHGFKLVDRGSIGGTWVNGERIIEYGPLDPSDEIEIAGFRIRLEPPGAAQPVGSPDAGDHAAQGSLGEPRVAAPDTFTGGPLATADSPIVAGEKPMFDEVLHWRRLMHRKLLHAIDLRRKDVRQLTEGQLREEARALLIDLIATQTDLPDRVDRDRLIGDILDEAIGLGPLERLLTDPDISEIMVNGPGDVFVERAGRLQRVDVAFTGEQAIRSVIDRIVAPLGRRIDESSPMVDARLADGSRVNAILPPLSVRSPSLTIRRFNRRLLEPGDLVRLGTLTSAMLAFLRVCVRTRRNIVISGGTGSGKTTLLNVLSNLIPVDERVVTIEDAAELRLCQQNLVSLEARPANAEGRGAVTIRDLVRNSLRMRPDRIVVGECRGGEALDMLQAMNTGHDGSLTTVHANSPRDVISRLETLVLMSGVEIPVNAIRDQIASAVDVIVHQARLSDGRRRIIDICEVTGIESNRVALQSIFRLGRLASPGSPRRDGVDGADAVAVPCGVVPQFYESLAASGQIPDLTIFGHGGDP